MSPAIRDRLLGVLTVAFSTSYVLAARSIEDSLLADAVGAGGVPQGVGIAMALAGIGVFATSWKSAPGAADAVPDELPTAQVVLRTVALVALLLAYALLLPWIGYVPAIFLLLLASGLLAGAPPGLTLFATAGLGAPLLWLLFDQVLQVRMPPGALWD